eukprot:gene4499-5097_t
MKKFECPSQIILKEIVQFSDFQFAGISQEIDPVLAKKIEELVKEGVCNVNEMRRHWRIFVTNDMFAKGSQPDKNNRRYFPRPKIIRSHIVQVKKTLSYSMRDLECLTAKVEQWRREHKSVRIFFRPKATQNGASQSTRGDSDSDDYDSDDSLDEIFGHKRDCLLFVYKTNWQRRLLERYGDELILLDATYRTTCYALPLFFLVVKTNVDHQVVAAFVCESESTESITKGLEVIKQWNTEFQPKYFMTDYSTEEISATKSVSQVAQLSYVTFIENKLGSDGCEQHQMCVRKSGRKFLLCCDDL